MSPVPESLTEYNALVLTLLQENKTAIKELRDEVDKLKIAVGPMIEAAARRRNLGRMRREWVEWGVFTSISSSVITLAVTQSDKFAKVFGWL